MRHACRRVFVAAILTAMSNGFAWAASPARFQVAPEISTGITPNAVLMADFNGDGHPDLAIAGQHGLDILLSDGSGSFQPAVNYSPGQPFFAIVSGDFNGDKKIDLALINSVDPGIGNPAGFIQVFLGNGDGTFADAQAVSTGGALPFSLAIGDLNADGKPDLAVSNLGTGAYSNTGNVSVLLGQGDGTFQPAAAVLANISSSQIAISDLNQDGKLDVVVLDPTPHAQSNTALLVLLGDGQGNFAAPVSSTAPIAANDFALADFNGDGFLDAVVTQNGPAINLLIGNGNGSFKSPLLAANLNFSMTSLAVGDFNGDGAMDVVLGSEPLGVVTLLPGNGNGIFQPATTYLAGNSTISLAVGDFNGDSWLDIAAVARSDNAVALLAGNGDGTLRAAPFTFIYAPGQLSLADFDKDSVPDLAVTETGNGVRVFDGLGRGLFQPTYFLSANPSPSSVAAADLNGDGLPDLILPISFAPSVSIVLNNGAGFQPEVQYPAGNPTGFPTGVAFGDLNGDNATDLVVTEGNAYADVLLNNGDGTFQPFIAYGTGNRGNAAALGDLNGDGKPDLVVSGSNGPGTQGVAIMLGNGDGTFQAASFYSGSISGYAPLALADLNGDGQLDAVVGGTAAITVFLGNGNGTLAAPTSFPVSDSASSLAVDDFNGDGKLDVALSGNFSQTISILYGNGDGTLQPELSAYSVGQPIALVTVDFNVDGAPDLAVTMKSPVFIPTQSTGVAVFFNRGGTFASLKASQPISELGDAITFTAGFVPSLPGTGKPTGRVSFKDGAAVLGSVPLSNTGQAAFTTTTLAYGTRKIQAIYGGDGLFLARSTPIVSPIVKRASIVMLSSSANPVETGQPVTFTATVSVAGPAVTGSISFTDGITPLATVPLTSGTAGFATSSLPAGLHVITAAYAGDANYGHSSGTLNQLINAPGLPATSLTLTVSATPATTASLMNPQQLSSRQNVTLNASINPANGPTGQVIFYDGTNAIGQPVSLISGAALLAPLHLARGQHALTAVYLGDGAYAGSLSPAVMVNSSPRPR